MGFSVANDLITNITAAAQAATGPGVYVTDGFFVSSDGSDVLMIGVPDFDGGDGNAVSGEIDFATTGIDGSHHETGSIQCVAVSWNGDAPEVGVPTARAAVWAIAETMDTLCRVQGGTDPAFGVERALWTRLGAGFDFDQLPMELGNAAILKFRIYYEGRP